MTDSSPVLLVVGATGPTGRLILDRAVRSGATVRALARRPEALADVPGVQVVRGDVRDRASLLTATDGADAVISSLGSPLTLKPVDLLSVGTRNLISAMAETGVRRLVCITGMGAGDSKGHGGFVYDRLVRPTVLRTVYADKDRQEDLVRRSGIDWVLVRPGMLTNGPSTGGFRQILTFGPGDRMGSISRADVADFVVGEAVDGPHHQQTVNLCT